MNKKFWAAVSTLTGTMIGAGILGIPYIFAKSGFLVGIFWLIVLGAILIFVNLALGEITLRTKGEHQLPGYAGKYLGQWGKYIMFFALIFGIYSALLAYLIGEGESISKIFLSNTNPIIAAFFFWIIMTILLRRGMKSLKRFETLGVIGVVVIVFGIFIKFAPLIKISNLSGWSPANFAAPIGIVFFSLLGFIAIPELRKEISGQEHLLKKAIIIGSIIPIFLYIIFSSVFVGVLGKSVTEVATMSFGPFVSLLGIFTMFTSYFVLSFSLKEIFKYDIKISNKLNFVFTSLVPLILYILVSQFKLLGFATILGIGGIISGGLTGALILIIAKKAKGRKSKRPEFQIPLNWTIVLIISLLFFAGIIVEFIN